MDLERSSKIRFCLEKEADDVIAYYAAKSNGVVFSRDLGFFCYEIDGKSFKKGCSNNPYEVI